MSIDLEGWDLHAAAIENRVDIARALIARGDDVDARAEIGYVKTISSTVPMTSFGLMFGVY